MTDITVIRNSGTNPGDDIEDPLITADNVAVARGRSVIDAATPASNITVACRYRNDIRLGDLVRVADPDQGPTYRAQVVAVTVASTGPADLTMQVRLWRPLIQ